MVWLSRLRCDINNSRWWGRQRWCYGLNGSLMMTMMCDISNSLDLSGIERRLA
jgi:hypothetical protein